MNNTQARLKAIESRLNTLRTYQVSMQEEIRKLEITLSQLKEDVRPMSPGSSAGVTTVMQSPVKQVPSSHDNQDVTGTDKLQARQQRHSAIENFIGTNLISKIGILITIIGVFIGARYAIDHELISPSMRVILSYAFAVALALVGLRLKKKYNAFSAVLMGGSIAIIYFSTYVAHGFYNMMPQVFAFAIMFVTTLLGVLLAIWYDQKVIALIGQVAAYAIPILLSDGSGRVAILFTYITIINTGLMILSFKKNWKIIYRIAFILTWSIYTGYIIFNDSMKLSWTWTLLFTTLCFITFYVTYLSYKIYRKELYNIAEVSVLLLNAVIYYALGYFLIGRQFNDTGFLTAFTLANAALHLIAGYGITRFQLADQSVRLFLFGQALSFITIAIPVKLDGSWVTLLWSIEAAVLLHIATSSQRKLYFQLCAVIMSITLISLIQDWSDTYYGPRYTTKPFLNQTFVTSLFAAGMFLFASFKSRTTALPFQQISRLRIIFTSWVPVVFLLVLYLGFFHEIDMFFDQVYASTNKPVGDHFLGVAALHIYSLVFLAAALWVNKVYVKDEQLFNLLMIASLVAFALQLTLGFVALRGLHNTPYLWVRYLNIAGIALLWYSLWSAKKQDNTNKSDDILLGVAFNIVLLTVICNEYVHWVRVAGSSSEYKLGLSVLFGVYALIMLFRGLLKNVRYLRISAIVLFAITIVKLFTYDLAALSTVGKTIVLIIVGVILLAASFLYNKYVKRNVSSDNS